MLRFPRVTSLFAWTNLTVFLLGLWGFFKPEELGFETDRLSTQPWRVLTSLCVSRSRTGLRVIQKVLLIFNMGVVESCVFRQQTADFLLFFALCLVFFTLIGYAFRVHFFEEAYELIIAFLFSKTSYQLNFVFVTITARKIFLLIATKLFFEIRDNPTWRKITFLSLVFVNSFHYLFFQTENHLTLPHPRLKTPSALKKLVANIWASERGHLYEAFYES